MDSDRFTKYFVPFRKAFVIAKWMLMLSSAFCFIYSNFDSGYFKRDVFIGILLLFGSYYLHKQCIFLDLKLLSRYNAAQELKKNWWRFRKAKQKLHSTREYGKNLNRLKWKKHGNS